MVHIDTPPTDLGSPPPPDEGDDAPPHAREPGAAAPPVPTPAATPWWRRPVTVLSVAVAGTVAVNLYWIAARRRGLPFNIDEAGYLQRAIRNSDALHAGGLVRLVDVVRGPDPQAPLLPVTAGVVHYLTGLGPYGLLGVQQLFAVVLAVSVYLVARRLMTPWWAVLTSVVVLALPGVIDQGRDFGFGLTAAAMVTAALAAQLGAADFQSTPRTLWWGALLGLAALSRTMVLSLLVALVLAAVVRLVASGPRWRPVVNVAAALALGFLVAWSWYSASWHAVWQYLTSYGYGSGAANYGPAHSVLSWQWWTFRLSELVNTDVFLPLSGVLAFCIAAGVVGVIVHRRRGAHDGPRREPRAALEGLRRWLTSDLATVVVYFVASYLILSSTRNEGWGFEVPLLAPAVVLVFAGLRRAPRPARRVAAVACCVAVAFSFVAQSGVLPGSPSVLRTVRLGPWHATVLDSRGNTIEYTESRLNSCAALLDRVPAARHLTCAAYAAEWATTAQRVSDMVWSDATARGRLPVLYLSTEDHFLNTNTVALDYQLAEHRALAIGVLAPRQDAGGASIDQQVDWGNLVLAGPASPVPNWTFQPIVGARQAAVALRTDGFTEIDHLVLPDGRAMGLWWKDQGPAAPPARR